MIDFVRIRMFILVAQLGSLARAARELKISSAAVSKQLSRLEQEIGLQLMIRSTRHITLTEVGVNYFEQCLRIIEEVDEASALVSQLKETPQGSLKVVCGRHFGMFYIVPHLKQFLTEFPKIRINLELAERSPDIVAEGIDVLIGMSISASGNAIQKKIASTRYVFCASPAYLKEHGIPEKPKDLLKHRYITHSMRKPDNELILRNEVLSLKPYLYVNDVEAMVKLALDDLGIIMLHSYAASEFLQKGTLIEILPNFLENTIPIYVAYPQRRFLPSKVRCFIDFVIGKINASNIYCSKDL